MQSLLDAVYPPQCLACTHVVASTGGLCPQCWPEVEFLTGFVCDVCGTPLLGEGEGEGAGAGRTDGARCDECSTIARPWTRGRAALSYRGVGRRLVLSLKSADRTDLPKAAAAWMLRAGAPILTPDMLVAPVPLHWIRLFQRRYNQSALLSAAVAQGAGLAHCPDLLVRRRATPSQDGRSRDARFANLERAIAVNERRRHRLTGRTVLIVDDVLTSGATLAASAEACLAAGAAEVRVLALARVTKGT